MSNNRDLQKELDKANAEITYLKQQLRNKEMYAKQTELEKTGDLIANREMFEKFGIPTTDLGPNIVIPRNRGGKKQRTNKNKKNKNKKSRRSRELCSRAVESEILS